MPTVAVRFEGVPGTEAAIGLAGGHTIVADRPEGRAGGMGLGFNGAQLLALAAGGCLCNDLRYVADAAGVSITELNVQVELDMEGAPLVASALRMTVSCRLQDGSDPAALIARAKASCMVSNSLIRGVPVDITAG